MLKLHSRTAYLATLGAIAVATIGCSDPSKGKSIKPAAVPQVSPVASITAITQDDANTIYADFYNVIKKEQHAAATRGKNVIIIMGENHISPNSLLIELIVADICKRQRIETAVVETDQSLLTVANSYAATRINNFEISPDIKKYEHSFADVTFAKLASMTMLFETLTGSGNNIDFLTHYLKKTDMTTAAGDPWHTQRQAIVDKQGPVSTLASPKFENAMVGALLSVNRKGSCMAVYGAMHVGYLAEQLKKRDIPTLGIWCAPDTTPMRQEDMPRLDLAKKQNIYFPSIMQDKFETTAVLALRMTLRASITDKLKRKEITVKQAQGQFAILQDLESQTITDVPPPASAAPTPAP